MAKYRRKKPRIRKRLVFLASVLVFFLLIWLYISVSVNPILRKVSEEKVRELATTAVNNAAAEVIAASGTDYADILDITKNHQGEIELINVNTLLINSLARSIVSVSQAKITDLGEQGIAIPIGTLSGMTFLAGQGPNVKIKVFPVGSVGVAFLSEFTQAGINQTRHKINLTVSASVSIIMPGMDKNVKIVTEVALCENIIIGKVPEVYLQSGTLTEMLNLIP